MRTPVSTLATAPCSHKVRVRHEDLTGFVTQLFGKLGLAPERAATAAEALTYGDLTGMDSHGVANLTRLYLQLFAEGRADPAADLEIVTDRGATVLVDAHRSLGLWAATEAMDIAMARAESYGVGIVSVFDATHFGCAGYHAGRAAARDMVGIVASNCGGQRIARPPHGRVTMLGTNPLSIAAPAAENRPYVLDMSTTVVPTGRIRAAARLGRPIPEGWLVDDTGTAVTDPAAFDRGEAHIPWLGNRPETGSYKGYGLSLMVEVLAALVPGAATGPSPDALTGDGRPSGRDDNIGFFVMALAPGTLRPVDDFRAEAERMFGSLLACPTTTAETRVRYPGWVEAERAERNLRAGVPLAGSLYDELRELADRYGLAVPAAVGGAA